VFLVPLTEIATIEEEEEEPAGANVIKYFSSPSLTLRQK